MFTILTTERFQNAVFTVFKGGESCWVRGGESWLSHWFLKTSFFYFARGLVMNYLITHCLLRAFNHFLSLQWYYLLYLVYIYIVVRAPVWLCIRIYAVSVAAGGCVRARRRDAFFIIVRASYKLEASRLVGCSVLHTMKCLAKWAAWFFWL